MRIQQRLNKLWSWLNEDRRAAEILALLVLLNGLCLIIPQSPYPFSDTVAQVRWLAQTSIQWQGPLRELAAVRLTHIRTTLWLRLPLAWLILVLAARADYLRTIWRTSPTPARLRRLLFITGGAFIISGWGLFLLLGWQVPVLTAWPDSPLAIPEHAIEMPTCAAWLCPWPGKAHLYLIRSGQTVGIEAQARDAEGNIVNLTPATKAETQPILQIALTDPGTETYFLVREGERIVRLNESVTPEGRPAVALQAFDAQSGALLDELTLAVDARATILADPVEIKVAVLSLSQYDAHYNPGALFESFGFLICIISLCLRDADQTNAPKQAEQQAAFSD